MSGSQQKRKTKTVDLGNPLIRLDKIDSTNSYAMKLLREQPVSEGTVILAGQQERGRGQGGSIWVSEPGKNLLFSVILKPGDLQAYKQFYLSMAVALGIHDYLTAIGMKTRIKWPNDLLIGTGKIAGILIENTILGQYLQDAVIGIGMNINQTAFPAGLEYAVSLVQAGGHPYDLDEVLTDLLRKLEARINQLYQEQFAFLKSAYLNQLWGLNRNHLFTTAAGPLEGRIVDVAETGELMIRHRNGDIQGYGFKELQFQPS